MRRLAIAGALLVALGAAVPARAWHADRAYVGSQRRIEMSWRCDRQADWTDPERLIRWLAADVSGFVVRRKGLVPGTIWFQDREHATFTADSGGALQLERQPTRLVGSCAVT